MTDAQFRAQAERDFRAAGWPADVAAFIAKQIGKPAPMDSRKPKAKASLKPKAYEVTLDRALAWFELPASMAAQFRAAGLTTADAAGPLLGRYFRAAVRRPADARVALAFDLQARKQWRKKV